MPKREVPWEHWLLPPSFYATRDNHLTPSNGFLLPPWGQQPDLGLKAVWSDPSLAVLLISHLHFPLAVQNPLGFGRSNACAFPSTFSHTHLLYPTATSANGTYSGWKAFGLSIPTKPVCLIRDANNSLTGQKRKGGRQR